MDKVKMFARPRSRSSQRHLANTDVSLTAYRVQQESHDRSPSPRDQGGKETRGRSAGKREAAGGKGRKSSLSDLLLLLTPRGRRAGAARALNRKMSSPELRVPPALLPDPQSPDSGLGDSPPSSVAPPASDTAPSGGGDVSPKAPPRRRMLVTSSEYAPYSPLQRAGGGGAARGVTGQGRVRGEDAPPHSATPHPPLDTPPPPIAPPEQRRPRRSSALLAPRVVCGADGAQLSPGLDTGMTSSAPRSTCRSPPPTLAIHPGDSDPVPAPAPLTPPLTPNPTAPPVESYTDDDDETTAPSRELQQTVAAIHARFSVGGWAVGEDDDDSDGSGDEADAEIARQFQHMQGLLTPPPASTTPHPDPVLLAFQRSSRAGPRRSLDSLTVSRPPRLRVAVSPSLSPPCESPPPPTDTPDATHGHEQVCHHGSCRVGNDDQPLHLCAKCDEAIHSDDSAGHIRFNHIHRPGGDCSLPSASRSLPGTPEASDEETNNNKPPTEDVDGYSSAADNPRLVRKRAVKARRHNTEQKQSSPSRGSPLLVPPSGHQRSQSLQGTELRECPDPTPATAHTSLPRHTRGSHVTLTPSSSIRSNCSVFSGHLASGEESDGDARQFHSQGGATGTSGLLNTHPPRGHHGSVLLRNQSSPGMLIGGGPSSRDLDDSDTPTSSPLPQQRQKKLRAVAGRLRALAVAADSDDDVVDGRAAGGVSAPKQARIDRRRPSLPVIGLIRDRDRDRKVSLQPLELFTVHFDVIEEISKIPEIEVVPAIKGEKLRKVLSSYMEKHALTFEHVDVFVANSKTPLTSMLDQIDCHTLAGQDLHIRAIQGNERQRHSSVRSNSSKVSRGTASGMTDTPSPHSSMSRNPSQTFKLFRKSKQDQLQELFASYHDAGLPPLPELFHVGRRQLEPSVLELETHWSDITDQASIPSKQQQQQEAVWELLRTEADYILNLQLILNVFMAVYFDMQAHQLLNEIVTDKVFSNLFNIHQANCVFWEEHFYPMLQRARQTRQPLDASMLVNGFRQFDKYFQEYSKFCLEFDSCRDYVIKKSETSELFKTYLTLTESLPECRRLTLRDFFIQPFQRITRYKILWERICDTDPSDSPTQWKELIQIVDTFLHRVNARIKLREYKARIEAYEAVEVPSNETCHKLVKAYSHLDLFHPMKGCSPHDVRSCVREGPLRLRDCTRDSKPVDVHCFLFTDMLLITRAKKTQKVKVIKPPLRLDKIVVDTVPGVDKDAGFAMVYLNEFMLATAAYTLHGETAREWQDAIQTAKQHYSKLRNCSYQQSDTSLFSMANGYEDYEEDQAFLNDVTADLPDLEDSVSTKGSEAGVGNTGSLQQARRHVSAVSSDVFFTAEDLPRSHSVSEDFHRSPRGAAAALSRDRPRSATFDFDPNLSVASSRDQSGVRAHGEVLPVPVQYTRFEHSPSRSPPGSPAAHPELRPDLRLSKLSSVDEDESGKKKRRDRDNPRYNTESMVHDLTKDKDASIQKRLSWTPGDKDHRPPPIRHKTISNDSLRSCLSSSGVSSVGYLSPENDIEEDSEETRWDTDPTLSHQDSASSGDTVVGFHYPPVRTASDRVADTSMPIQPLSPGNKAASKSLPNIAQIGMAGAEVEPGVSAGGGGGSPRQASPYHMKKLRAQMKKELLLNSTLEATDV